MQFLYPTYLWGFLLVLIPIIIHLFQLRRYRLVYFSSLKFLKQLDIEQKRRSRLKELLLLLIRILLISMLVLAFAHPYFPGKTAPISSQQSVGIYIDNSLSMENEADGQSLLDHAKEAALKIIEKHPEETRFFLLHNSNIFNSKFPLETREAITVIESLSFSSATTSISLILERFDQITNNLDEGDTKMLYIFSDYQNSFLNTGTGITDPDFNTILGKLPNGISNNIFIDSCWFNSPVNSVDKRLTLHARIRNNSDQDLNRFPVHLIIQDSLLAQETASIGAYSSDELEFSYNLENGGWQKGKIEIRDYPVSFDNQFYFTYFISEKAPVLQIYTNRENQHLKALFESDPYFEYHNSPSGAIPYQDLGNFKLIILNSVESFSPNLSKLLHDYVEQGGNLFVIPGREGSMAGINRFTRSFDAPVFSNLIVRKTEVRIPDNMQEFYDRISMNPDQQVELPSFLKYYRLVGNLPKSEPILSSETGRPILSRSSFGNGFVNICASPLFEEFTNFQVHPLFVPFMYFLANSGIDQQSLYHRIGRVEPVPIEVVNTPGKGPVRILNPDGNKDFIPKQFKNQSTGQLMIHFNDYSGFSGILDVVREEETEACIAVNYSYEESQIENLSPREIQKVIIENSLSNVSLAEAIEEDIPSDNIRIKGKSFPLVRILLLLAIVFLVSESIIHRFKT